MTGRWKSGTQMIEGVGRRLWLAWFAALPAFAHEQSGRTEGFAAGLLHPVTGLDHVLAMLAVGLWGAQLGAPSLWLLPVTFPIVMSVGGLLGLLGIGVPGVELGVAASALLLGVAVAREAQWKPWAAAAVVGSFAIFHGHAHGTELPQGQNGMAYSIGFVISTGSLHLAGIAIGMLHKWRAGRMALRILGGLVAMAGAVFVWRALE